MPRALAAVRWRAAFGLSVDQLAAWGILYYSVTVLSLPVADDLGLSHGLVTGALSVSLLTSGLLAPRVGRWSDRRGARELMSWGGMVGCASFLALSAIQGPIGLLACFVLLGVAQSQSLYDPAFRAIVDWFPEAGARGRALLLLTSVGGLASTVFLPLTALLVTQVGWRPTAVGFACILGLLIAPGRLWLPRRATAHVVPPVQPTAPQAVESTVRPGPSASWLAGTFAVAAFASTGITLYLIWQQVEQGSSVPAAAALAGLAGGAQVPGRLLLAGLQPRLATRYRLPLLLFVQAAASIAVAVGHGAIAVAGVVGFGAASGMMTLERATVLVQWYGPAGFGARNGRIVAGAAVAKAAAPLVVAAAHVWVNYAAIFLGSSCLFVVGGGLALLAVRAHDRESTALGTSRWRASTPSAPRA